MTALPQRPRVAETLLTAVLRNGVPGDRERAAQALGLVVDQLQPVRHGELRADLDLPSGSWHVWPVLATAMWVGEGDPPALPGGSTTFDVTDAAWQLADAGWLLREGALAAHGMWAVPARSRQTYAALAAEGAQALWAVWATPAGRTVRGGIAQDGRVWATSTRDARDIILTILGGTHA